MWHVSGVMVRSSLWLRFKNIMPMPDDDVSVLFCTISSVSIFYQFSKYIFLTLYLGTLIRYLDKMFLYNQIILYRHGHSIFIQLHGFGHYSMLLTHGIQ